MKFYEKQALACLLVLFGAVSSRAEERVVRIEDGAKLFNSKTVAKALDQLKHLSETHDLDFTIETIKEIPEETRETLGDWKFWNKRRHLHSMAEERAGQKCPSGIAIEITVDPPFVAVINTSPDLGRFVGGKEREEIRKRFVENLKSNPDLALSAGIDRMEYLLKNKYPLKGYRTSPVSSISILLLFGIFLGIWGILALVWSRVRNRTVAPSSTRSSNDETLPVMLGGMFGVVSGFGIYDKLLQLSTPTSTLANFREASEQEDNQETEDTLSSSGPKDDKQEGSLLP